jgi:rhodanese-related sulfurtransferase
MAHSPEFLKLVDESKSKIKQLTTDQVMQKMQAGEKFHFVDCREDDEWREGYAKGAIHIGRGVLERDIEEEIPNKEEPIVLYCGGGFRSALAAESIQKMGYKNVISMDGGIREWKQKGYPIAKD